MVKCGCTLPLSLPRPLTAHPTMLRLSACIIAIAACELAAARGLEEYEPCLDKAEGDSCTLCSPSDVDCIETMVVKVCVEGECTGVSTPTDDDEEEEAAGACECGWTSTYPCPGTPRRWWQRFAADDGSACFNYCCPKSPPSAPPAPPAPPPTPPFVCETGCAWTDLHPCPGTPKKFWQTYATDDGTDCFNACCPKSPPSPPAPPPPPAPAPPPSIAVSLLALIQAVFRDLPGLLEALGESKRPPTILPTAAPTPTPSSAAHDSPPSTDGRTITAPPPDLPASASQVWAAPPKRLPSSRRAAPERRGVLSVDTCITSLHSECTYRPATGRLT